MTDPRLGLARQRSDRKDWAAASTTASARTESKGKCRGRTMSSSSNCLSTRNELIRHFGVTAAVIAVSVVIGKLIGSGLR